MIELTLINISSSKSTGKITFDENKIVVVEERNDTTFGTGDTKRENIYTVVTIDFGNYSRDIFVSESYDRVLRLAKM